MTQNHLFKELDASFINADASQHSHSKIDTKNMLDNIDGNCEVSFSKLTVKDAGRSVIIDSLEE